MNCQNCEKLERELLSAQAAIESMKSLDKTHDLLPWKIKKMLESIDLSLLHEHDAEVTEKATQLERQRWQGVHADLIKAAEVRKPLVEVMERIVTADADEMTRGEIVWLLKNALAKVKE